MWPQRIQLGSNVNSIQRTLFQEQRYPKKECGKGSLAQSEFSLPEVCRQMSIRRAEVCMLWRSSGGLVELQVQNGAQSCLLLQQAPRWFDSMAFKILSKPETLASNKYMHVLSYANSIPLTSRCGPVAASYKKRVLGNFPDEAKVQHKWHVVTFPPQRNRTG